MRTFLISVIFIIICSTLEPNLVFAQYATPADPTPYELLAPLPGYVPTTDDKTTAGPYIKGIFTLIIAIAGGLAVVKIIIGGIQYMSTDAFQGKSDAKDTIQNAVWGLLLAISAWLILYTINPNLVEFNLSIPPQPLPIYPTPGSGPGGPGAGSCTDCTLLAGIPHKTPAENGCLRPGPCQVSSTLLPSLLNLYQRESRIEVTESYPPTRSHRDPCHNAGTCVDIALKPRTLQNSSQNIKNFIDNASSANLTAVFETTSEARANVIRQATGLTAAQVKYVPGITGEHFSVK